MKRLLIFVHYNPRNKLSAHVLYTLERFRPHVDRLVLVSNSALSGGMREQLALLDCTIIQRANRGFDFGAWKDALMQLGWFDVMRYDSVTLMNDSCFGPLCDVGALYAAMERDGADFWGITNGKATEAAFGRKTYPIREHIQSYFMCFNREVVGAPAFQQFWSSVQYLSNMEDVIIRYEVGLTPLLSDAGFRYRCVVDTHHIDIDHANLAIDHPDALVAAGVPFVKVKAFRWFANQAYLSNLIGRHSDYPLHLIEGYFREQRHPVRRLLKHLFDNLVGERRGAFPTHEQPQKPH
jgi:rhamnosyltransferase